MESHLEPHEKVYRSKSSIIINNFIGGLSWAVGATIGIALIVALLTFIIRNVNLVPVIGNFISDVIKEIIATNPQWTK